MLLHGIDTNKVNILQILVGVTSLVDGDAKVLGVSFPSLLAYESGKAVADTVFSSYQSWQCDTVVSGICALIHTQPHRTLVERVESAHFLKMLSDETCCGWRVGTKINVSSFIVEFVWRVFRPINWTRDYILQEIVRELDYAQLSSRSAGAANINTCICECENMHLAALSESSS